MSRKIQLARVLAKTPLHSILRTAHRKLVRYIDAVENWENGDEATNGEAFLVRVAGPHLQVALDIGANLGRWSLLLTGVNPRCRIHAFEASPATFRSLTENVRGFPLITPRSLGLGEREATLEFLDYGANSGLSSFVSRKTTTGLSEERRVQVPVTTVDRFLAEVGAGTVDFVKIDTEGFEMAILRGMRGCLADRRVNFIQFEYGGTWLDAKETLAGASELLSGHGYHLFRLLPRGLERVIYRPLEHECFKYSNFAAVPSEEILQRWGIPVATA